MQSCSRPVSDKIQRSESLEILEEILDKNKIPESKMSAHIKKQINIMCKTCTRVLPHIICKPK